MRICVFGAGGDTGKELVNQGVERGYEVTAFVRNGRAYAFDTAKADVVTGDAMVPDDVKTAVTGAHAVLSALGHGLRTPRGMHERSIDNIINAMETEGVARLISLTGSGVRHPDDDPPVLDGIMNWMFASVAPRIITDGRAHANRIRRSDLDWTIVRAGKLTNATPSGTYYSSEIIHKASPFMVSRGDAARFMLDQLTDDRYIKKCHT